jgi:hypothetical protein
MVSERVETAVPVAGAQDRRAHELHQQLVAFERGRALSEVLEAALELGARNAVERVRVDALDLAGEVADVAGDR